MLTSAEERSASSLILNLNKAYFYGTQYFKYRPKWLHLSPWINNQVWVHSQVNVSSAHSQGCRSSDITRTFIVWSCFTYPSLMIDNPGCDIMAMVFNQVPGKYMMSRHIQDPRGIYRDHGGGLWCSPCLPGDNLSFPTMKYMLSKALSKINI